MPSLHPRVRGAGGTLTTRPAPTTSPPAGATTEADDAEAELVRALRAGDENAFEALVTRLHPLLLRTAINYVRDPSAAEDVVQETWVGFLGSLERFEGRCTVKTWLFRILFNKAQSRAAADRRLVPFSTLAAEEVSARWDSIDPASFHAPGGDEPAGHWVEPPPSWKTDPEQMVRDHEVLTAVARAIDELPPAQGTVIWMRDVEGMSSREVCNALDLTATNQRVLLHRARTKVRRALAARYGSET